MNRTPLYVLLAICLSATCAIDPLVAETLSVPQAGAVFAAVDTVDVSDEESEDARECLQGLGWPAEKFQVHCEPSDGKNGDLLVRFPSARPTGNATNDLVAMEWYVARDKDGQPLKAPAMVVVHESGSNMAVGRVIAQGLRAGGVHALMIQLPYYGQRKPEGTKLDGELFISATRQGIADVRRARDAVAALPLIDHDRIGLQGTSLGGFVAATTAGLDNAYDAVFLMLAGGDLYDVIMSGAKDAAEYRKTLAAAGFTDEKLKTELRKVEPNRLAHRLNAAQTWLYSGMLDDVVPIKNARILAKAAGLDRSHHIEMIADHYSGIVYVPFVLDQMSHKLKAVPSP
jgi:dienelactone hydrolase